MNFELLQGDGFLGNRDSINSLENILICVRSKVNLVYRKILKNGLFYQIFNGYIPNQIAFFLKFARLYMVVLLLVSRPNSLMR
jgi:hypothetical protein